MAEYALRMSPQEIASRIKGLAAEIGYTGCGITSARPFVEYRRALADRIRRFPDAAELYEPMQGRVNPRSSRQWARSVVVCVRRYGKYEEPAELVGHIGRNYLFDLRNPLCPDHDMPVRMKSGLRELGLRVRKGGVPDRWAAVRAGVARFGRNCFAISEHGSWINLETWMVDVELPEDAPTLESPCPPGCDACIRACPTGALSEPFVMRMDTCIAYLTYGAPLPVAPELWDRMGPWIYGCDACQEVCPLNRGAWQPQERAEWLDPVASMLTPRALAEMDEKTYRDVVHPLFWYIPPEDAERWRANARRALEHSTRSLCP